ncbi:NAD(P)H-dependent oxidoreductase [Micromonospora sp. HNM0581]|uniref:NADPH-dependent FMN reductase n=1 Tax=Micromonospora sp. HNM0581 TaxID=2716341 RepID=UPI00146F1DFA|nr:NAD(P)H-dependent oxidoreductase [Micromonospora sp. HNM0581]NLU80619.1 NAD(P)H-dependent oxidoreductase [Micromonospora sp. HNM0581]
MSAELLKIAVIVGSTRKARFGPVVAGWFAEQVRQRDDMELDLVDLVEAALPYELPDFHRGEEPAPVRALAPRLAAADGFVFVTPEYNHSYPASLKNVVDWYLKEWQAKPVGFVSYGGLAGGLRAVEHLRPILSEVHAITVRDVVSFHGVWERFDTSGRPVEPQGCNAAAKTMLDQLAWWARALRTARAERPYGA